MLYRLSFNFVIWRFTPSDHVDAQENQLPVGELKEKEISWLSSTLRGGYQTPNTAFILLKMKKTLHHSI